MPATRSTLIATITYRDRRTAIDWLEKAFGFETVMLLETPSGEIAHCEMKLGDGAIAVGSEWAEPYRSPASVGGWHPEPACPRRGGCRRPLRARQGGGRGDHGGTGDSVLR